MVSDYQAHRISSVVSMVFDSLRLVVGDVVEEKKNTVRQHLLRLVELGRELEREETIAQQQRAEMFKRLLDRERMRVTALQSRLSRERER